MKRKDWIVTESSSRPAGLPGECFYCRRKIGEQHKDDCVIRSKTVVVDFTVRMVVEVPEFWDQENIEFKYNHGTWCADNLIDMLERSDNGCLCPYVEAEYIKEATKEDEDDWELVKVNELES